MKASIPTLLRRTAAIIVATGSFCFIGEAAAAPPINYPGGSCTLARIIITPSGGLAIECETAAGTTPTITLGSPSSMTVNTVASFSINRSGDNGAINVSWSASGVATGCNTGGILSFTPGVNSLLFSITPTAIGSCNVAITVPAGLTTGVLGPTNQTQAAYTVASTAAPASPSPSTPASPSPSTPAAGCPVPPTDLLEGSLVFAGGPRITMASGRIYSSLLPLVTDRISGSVKLGEASISPQVMQSIEMSISKCKGQINTVRGGCYLKSPQGGFNSLTWTQSSIPGISDADGQAMGVCYAKLDEGQWYFNLRYNYTECYYGTCGYVLQWNYGPF